MDKELKVLLNKLTIADEEIAGLVELCPGLDIVDWNNAGACIKIVVDAGYPIEDISSLIYVNPGFMMYDPNDLISILEEFDGDIEEILKDNPFLI